MASEFLKDFPVDVESLKAERKAKAEVPGSGDALVAWSGAFPYISSGQPFILYTNNSLPDLIGRLCC